MTDKTKIEELVQQELEEANKLHPMFQTPHGATGVIWEEYEETIEELEQVKMSIKYAWKFGVRKDDKMLFKMDTLSAKGAAIKAIQECIQVAAMCQKALDSNLYE